MENNYYDFMNQIKDMDAVLYDNNGDIDVDWYKAVDERFIMLMFPMEKIMAKLLGWRSWMVRLYKLVIY